MGEPLAIVPMEDVPGSSTTNADPSTTTTGPSNPNGDSDGTSTRAAKPQLRPLKNNIEVLFGSSMPHDPG